MGKIEMTENFSSDIYVKKESGLSGLNFNTKVECPSCGRVFIEEGKKEIRDGVINPDKRGFFKRTFGKKVDDKVYTLYFINGSAQHGSTGGNMKAETKVASNTPVNWQASFSYQLFSASTFIKKVIGSIDKKFYSTELVVEFIRKRINGIISEELSKRFKKEGKDGVDRFESYKSQVINMINGKLEVVSGEAGLSIIIIDIKCDKDENDDEIQHDHEVRNYIHNNESK